MKGPSLSDLKKDLERWIHFPVRQCEGVGVGRNWWVIERNWRILWMVACPSEKLGLGHLLTVSRYVQCWSLQETKCRVNLRKSERTASNTWGSTWTGLTTNDHILLHTTASLLNSHLFLKAQFRCNFLWGIIHVKSHPYVLFSLESLDFSWVSGTYQVFNTGLPDEWVLHGIARVNS